MGKGREKRVKEVLGDEWTQEEKRGGGDKRRSGRRRRGAKGMNIQHCRGDGRRRAKGRREGAGKRRRRSIRWRCLVSLCVRSSDLLACWQRPAL